MNFSRVSFESPVASGLNSFVMEVRDSSEWDDKRSEILGWYLVEKLETRKLDSINYKFVYFMLIVRTNGSNNQNLNGSK